MEGITPKEEKMRIEADKRMQAIREKYQDDPDSRMEELNEQARERHLQEMDAYFYPAEGPK